MHQNMGYVVFILLNAKKNIKIIINLYDYEKLIKKFPMCFLYRC